jgi:type II secretory ATPase GspE/PulE/Tfp pilus assembly ATPase PilB-like protein
LRDHKGNIVPCNFCNDLGFNGRFGVFEIFQIDDEIKKVVVTGGSEAQLKQAFRKQKGRLLQEVALSQVQAGETSVEEVLRVLKTESPSGGSSSGRGPAPGPGSEPRQPQPKPRPATT